MVIVCPQAIGEVFPNDPIPFIPGVADIAGLSTARPSHDWYTNWACGNPLEFGKHALSGFPNDNTPLLLAEDDADASTMAFEKVLLQHFCPAPDRMTHSPLGH
jgi:hypothetical protein